jgi:hypothetical protein
MWHVVSSLPGCLASGPSCHLRMISYVRSPSGGMTRHPLRSFQNGPVGVCIASIGNASSHYFISDVSSVCILVIQCSSEPGESVLKTLMNACSGIIIMSWLSSLPLSALGGLDKALAAVWVFPGTCSRMKW